MKTFLMALCVLAVPCTALAQGGGSPIPFATGTSAVTQGVNAVARDLGGGGAAATQAGNAAASAVDTARALSDLDRQIEGGVAEPDAEAPPVPSSCVDRGPACEECFAAAYEQLARSRVLLLRARALFDATHRFATSAQRHGDNVAPMTREAALVWQMQKPRIALSLKEFDSTYDRKIADMLAVVEKTLQELGRCEKLHYDNPDWYARFGFIYFEFLKSRFQRA